MGTQKPPSTGPRLVVWRVGRQRGRGEREEKLWCCRECVRECVSELGWREPRLGQVGLTQGRKKDSGTTQHRVQRHPPMQGSEAETNTDAPDAVTLSQGETANWTKEPHGPQARQMKIHVGQTGTELWQEHWQTGTMRAVKTDTQHAQQRHKRQPQTQGEPCCISATALLLGGPDPHCPSPGCGAAGWGSCCAAALSSLHQQW